MRQVIHSEIYEGELMASAALIKDPEGTVLTNSEVTDWVLKIYDLGERDPIKRKRHVYLDEITVSGENTVAALPGAPVIWNTTTTPRNDDVWDGPPPGYNFLFYVTAAKRAAHVPAFNPVGGHKYLMQYVFNTDWDDIVLDHYITVRQVGE